jgi:hypothetical protein
MGLPNRVPASLLLEFVIRDGGLVDVADLTAKGGRLFF